ncbi:MAG: hypothetical protein QOE87_2255 [Gaiellales bacterium]|jgi:hypothetical protein|nr:hypothetical protein [Gaiellales bacterium]
MLRALVRFWWVAIVGILLAGLVFVFATYKVTLGVPPKLEARAQSTYTASTQMLITSKRDPYLSAANVNNKVIKYPSGTTDTTTGTTTGTTGTTAPTQTYGYDNSGADGDLQRLVEIANSLPPRVTSDPVINLRNKDYRRIDGSVTAVNPYAFSGAGGFRSGPLPYIKINGTANSPQDAVDITNTTALAFKKWFEARQVQGGTKIADRVLVEQVNSANSAVAQGGSKPLLGVGAALLVLLGAAGFALALERLIPRRSARSPRSVAPAAQDRAAAAVAPDHAPLAGPELPALEVPTMMFAAQVEEGTTPTPKKKPSARSRKGSSNGSANGTSNGSGLGSASSGRRREAATPPRVAPSTDDAG